MRRRAWGPVLGAVLYAGAGVPAAPASATAPAYVTTINSLYVYGDVTITQGSTLTLVNLETISHDLVSSDPGPDGQPLFASRQTAGAGDRADVVGVPALPEGVWPYFCTLHEAMRGTIQVLPV